MFSERPWRELIEDVQNMLAATNDLSSVQDEKQLHFKKGEISIMRWLISLEEVTNEAYKQLMEEE